MQRVSASLRQFKEAAITVTTDAPAQASRRYLIFYVALAYAWSWGCFIFLIAQKPAPFSTVWSLAYVSGLSGPFLAALVTTFAQRGLPSVRALLLALIRWRAHPLLYVACVVIPLLVLLLASFGSHPMVARHDDLRLWLSSLPVLAIKMMVRGGPLNEEPGWRGYLLPALLWSCSPFLASLLVWAVWTLWHLPLWFIGGLPHHEWPFAGFALLLLPVTFLFTALHRSSNGSVLLAILLHTMLNLTLFFSAVLTIYQLDLQTYFLRTTGLWLLVLVGVCLKQPGWFKAPLPSTP